MELIKKYFIAIAILIVVGVSTLINTRTIDSNFRMNNIKLITDMTTIRDSISQHQKDALYLPYKLRLVMFNETVYGYQTLKNIFSFWSINNINRSILIINLYPIFWGFVNLWKNDRFRFWLCVWAIIVCSVVVGLNKMVDARSATLSILPVLIYLIYQGWRRVDFKIYVIGLVISIILAL